MNKTQVFKITDIKENTDNPRKISKPNLNKLIKSIEDFPAMLTLRPIVIDENNKILGGNMRFKAMKELGFKEIECLIADNLTEEQKKEFIIKDNTDVGEWDFELLKNWEIDDLIDWGMQLPHNFRVVEEDDFHIPDEIITDIKQGDIFQIGNHRIMCGDSTNSDDFKKLMNGEKGDMVFTDPPYNVDYGANKKHPSWKIRSIKNDKLDKDEWILFNENFINNIKDNYKGGDIYVWGAGGPEGMRQRLLIVDLGFNWSTTIIWKKQQMILTPAKYQRIYEPCFYGWLNKSTFVGDRKEIEVWEIDRPHNSKEHPTMKPIDLCAKGIRNSSKDGDIVLDPFLGSGSTLIAAHQLNRKCYGLELDPKYCQVIIDRIKKVEPNIQITKI